MRIYAFFLPRIPTQHPKLSLLTWSENPLIGSVSSIDNLLVLALCEILHKTDLNNIINEFLIAKIKGTVSILFFKIICHWPLFCNTWLFFGWIFVIVNIVVLGFSDIKPSGFLPASLTTSSQLLLGVSFSIQHLNMGRGCQYFRSLSLYTLSLCSFILCYRLYLHTTEP